MALVLCFVNSCQVGDQNVKTTISGQKKITVNNGHVNVKGNRKIVENEVTLTPFDRIYNGSNAEIFYHVSDEYKAVISTDSNLSEYVTVEVSDEVLNINLKGGTFSFTKLFINIYSPELKGVTISGYGNFTAKNPVQTSVFEANIYGMGDININGEVDELKVSIEGLGSFKGEKFATNHVIASIEGLGSIFVHVNESLTAEIDGIGRIRYSGNPTIVSQRVEGIGRIRKR